jgi:hypothetical protein
VAFSFLSYPCVLFLFCFHLTVFKKASSPSRHLYPSSNIKQLITNPSFMPTSDGKEQHAKTGFPLGTCDGGYSLEFLPTHTKRKENAV